MNSWDIAANATHLINSIFFLAIERYSRKREELMQVSMPKNFLHSKFRDRVITIFFVILKFLPSQIVLILFNNYVSFNEYEYRELRCAAIEAYMTPRFPNIYSVHKYRELFQRDPQRRDADDVFVVIESMQSRHELMNDMMNEGVLQLTHEISERKVMVLDLEIFKGPRFKKTILQPANKFLYSRATRIISQ